jgi:hypothetical protein
VNLEAEAPQLYVLKKRQTAICI